MVFEEMYVCMCIRKSGREAVDKTKCRAVAHSVCTHY